AWHMQAPDTWPVFYESSRRALEDDGVYAPSPDRVETYFRFLTAFRSLHVALGTGRWELEHLCERGQEGQAIEPPVDQEAPVDTPASEGARVWLIAPGPNASLWDEFHREGIAAIGWDGLGDLSRFQNLEEVADALRRSRGEGPEPMHDALACWEFAKVMRPGDVVFAKKGRRVIVGHGIVESDYTFDSSRSQYQHTRRVRWLHSGAWKPRDRPLVTKTLTDITTYAQLVADIRRAIGLDDDEDEPLGIQPATGTLPQVPVYGLDQATGDRFRPRETIEGWVELARHRRNVVLQGPPGVGKTFLADRLASLIIGRRDPQNVCVVQFHQSYSYEDFVQGYRPSTGGGFELRDGPFLRFCDRALQDREDRYVLIIDEINRGNVSKVLGELMMLIEPDKRDPKWGVKLAYAAEDDKPFYVPPNLYLIGTMNTADRSLAMVDYALRRRFAFIDVEPAFDSPGFENHLARMGVAPTLVARIRDRVRHVNAEIDGDDDLGRGFRIGHSYFCARGDGAPCDERWFSRIVEYEIGPLLREYWFDRRDRAEAAEALLLADD
ncbi:MAG: AAA family ATPase, partial [Planctomycetes bacterium]|nr:AAA family ATPase [Planctomycetota bacterium]